MNTYTIPMKMKPTLYAFTKLEKLRGIDFDDRYGKVGGPGPIRVNKKK